MPPWIIPRVAPLFEEWIRLCDEADLEAVVERERLEIGPEDALVVVDMQNDFVPIDSSNPHGGSFGVPEGADVAAYIVQLMELFAAFGATVVPTRDYHPVDHCSFCPVGPFPAHCVQGTVGAHFYEPVAASVEKMQRLGRSVEVVFKGFNEDIDSFGSFEYPDDAATFQRLSAKRARRANGESSRRLIADFSHGCSLCSWTGCYSLKRSSRRVNSPPDVMAVLSREKLVDKLKKLGIKRVFSCGLAMDYCVLDTTVNAKIAGFEAYLIMDAARAAHLKGVGPVGSGFLTSPAQVKKSVAQGCVKAISMQSIVGFEIQAPLKHAEALDLRGFPASMEGFALIRALDLGLRLDLAGSTFEAAEPAKELEALQGRGVRTKGAISQPARVSIDAGTRQALGVPQEAVQFVWAYPVEHDQAQVSDMAWAYFSTASATMAFLALGGFVYLDEAGRVLSAHALSIGDSLSFKGPQRWPGGDLNKSFSWHAVTSAALRQRGARKFTWIRPNDSGLEGSGLSAAHGGFAYRFEEGEAAAESRDVFFAVQGFEESRCLIGRLSSDPAAAADK